MELGRQDSNLQRRGQNPVTCQLVDAPTSLGPAPAYYCFPFPPSTKKYEIAKQVRPIAMGTEAP